jgi:hypothetical protein
VHLHLPLLLATLLLALGPEGLLSQECPQGRIDHVFVDNRSIFPTHEMDPDTPFLWAYKLANALHVRTRESFVRNELLFRKGECLDSLRLAETERLLRGYRFIRESDVFAVEQPDGGQHVIVDTQDEWSTRLDLGIRLDEGVEIFGARIVEENFLGRGMRLRLFFDQEREQRDLGLEFFTPRLLGTRWDARLGAGRTRNGSFFEEALMYPFAGEVGRFGARQSYLWRESLQAFSLGEGEKHTHLLMPFLDRRADVAVGGRAGEPGGLTVFGMGVSWESLRFQEFPDDVELVVDGNFSETVPADSATVAPVAEQALTRSAHRITLYLGQRNLHFVKRTGLDRFGGVQDIQTGTEVFLGLSRGFEIEGKDGTDLPDDIHAQVSLFGGKVWPDWTLNSRLAMEARRVSGDSPGDGLEESRWEDVFGEADVYLYWQPPSRGGHTLLFRASGAGGWSVRMPFQLTLGGRTGVRGYRQGRFPGGRRAVFTLEDRVYLPWPAPEVFDLGLTFFGDLGIMDAGGAPFGRNSGWRGAIGAGIRFGLPPGTARLARIDLALPIGGKTRLEDLILRISLEELLGLLPGVRDRQLLRSLRAGVRPDLMSVPF